jgi:RNA polymerase-binding protein DksA
MPPTDTLTRRLPALRRQLRERRRALLARVARDETDLRGLGGIEAEEADEAQEDATAQLLIALDDRERREITAIDAALARMDEDAYGRCQACRRPIALTRLCAIPEATTCRTCAERDEGLQP